MPLLLRFREYVEAAKLARHCADSERNRQAKQILHEIERSYYRLVELEKWMVDQQQYNRPMTHFGLFNGRFATREDIVSTSADQDGRIWHEARIRLRAPAKQKGLDLFHDYRSEIENLASAKYDAGKITSDGLVVVDSPDLSNFNRG